MQNGLKQYLVQVEGKKMKVYQELLNHILSNGVQKGDRTGTGTLSVFGYQMRFDLSQGFPLLTTKKIFWRGVAEELFWMIRGETNVKSLQENNVHIWDEWANEKGDLGPVYGAQWRSWSPPLNEPHHDTGIDQLANVIERIKTKPECRRLIVTAWNPAEVESMALPSCHCFFQFYVADGKLSCHMYQRSADIFLGVPFNIASYALLTHLVAVECDLKVGDFVHSFGDVHIYNNHIEQVKEQLRRKPKPLPQLTFKHLVKVFDAKFEDLILTGYKPDPVIKAAVSV